eukprot:227769-Pyramimonas_sp.AAC.1
MVLSGAKSTLKALPLFLAFAHCLICASADKDHEPTAFFNAWNQVIDVDAETPGPQYPVPPVVVKNPKIFIGTSAYRDMACPKTLFDAFDMADHPERLFMGVVDQTTPMFVMWPMELCDAVLAMFLAQISEEGS